MKIVTTIIACLLLLNVTGGYRLHAAEAAGDDCGCAGKGCCAPAPVNNSQSEPILLPPASGQHDWQLFPPAHVLWKLEGSDLVPQTHPDLLLARFRSLIQLHLLDCRFQI